MKFFQKIRAFFNQSTEKRWLTEEEHFQQDIQYLDEHHPGWNHKSRVSTAGYTLQRRDRETVVLIYGEKIVREAEELIAKKKTEGGPKP